MSLLRGTRQVPVKTEEQPASLLKDAGAGKCLLSGVVPRSETRLPGQCSPRTDIRVTRKPLGHRHFPSPSLASPHTHRVCSKRHRSSCSYRPAQPHLSAPRPT